MRLLALFLAFLLAAVLAWRPVSTGTWQNLSSYVFYAPCARTITFKVGDIDPRYRMDRTEFTGYLKQAAEAWNKAYGQTLLSYDPNGTITVNMTYDIRQQLSTEVSQRESRLKQEQSSYEEQLKQYQADVSAFESRLSDFKSQVNYWNSQGGAPPEEYDKLKAEEQSLQAEADRLNSTAARLNVSSESFNSQVRDFRGLVSEFSRQVKNRPEEGQYDSGSRIVDIFFYTDITDLRHTMVHEFGHVIGIGHVADKNAVMYEYANDVLIPNPADRSALADVCRERPVYEVAAERIWDAMDFLSGNFRSGSMQ